MTILLSMNTRSSVRPRLTFKARMMARMFGMTVAITKTMTISRTMRRSEEGIKILLSFVESSTSACQTRWA